METPTETQVVVDEPRLETEEQLWEETGAGDHDGWYCVRTNPFPCPAPGCDFVAEFMTAAHLILVWEAMDRADPLRPRARAAGGGPPPGDAPLRAGVGAARVLLRRGSGGEARPRNPPAGLGVVTPQLAQGRAERLPALQHRLEQVAVL